MEENSPQGIWDHIADEMLLEFDGGVKSVLPTTEIGYGNSTNTARRTTRALRTSMRQITSTTSTMTRT